MDKEIITTVKCKQCGRERTYIEGVKIVEYCNCGAGEMTIFVKSKLNVKIDP